MDQFNQNYLFQNNQRTLFEKLKWKTRTSDTTHNAEESRNSWGGIWNREVAHNERSEWLENVEKEIEIFWKQREIVTTIDSMTKQLRKLPNWKVPGLDGVHGYWLKYITT